MKSYSIIRVGNEYVVLAGENSILKTTSRRRAARLITDAAELLDCEPAPTPDAHPASSMACDPSELP